MRADSKIYVAGHNGLVGKSLVKNLKKRGYTNIITRSSKQLNLIIQRDVESFFIKNQPEFVILAAAKVGNAQANSEFPAEFIYNNLMIEANVINSAYKYGVKKLLFVGSACVYPKKCKQPIKESYLLSGQLEKNDAPHAVAKISGIKMIEAYNQQYATNFISCMPTNLYGPNDHFTSNSSTIPQLIAKINQAKKNKLPQVVISGISRTKHEFLYVDDLTDALILLMNNYNSSKTINIGYGKDISTQALAYQIKLLSGYKGELIFNNPSDDQPNRKLLDSSKIHNLGWKPKTTLKQGLLATIKWYQDNYTN